MLYYNWNRLKRIAKSDPNKILTIFKSLVNREKTLYTDKIYSGKCDNFVFNEKAIVKNELHGTPQDIAVYLYIASLRNYLVYKMTGITYVPFNLLSDGYDLEKLKLNKLLKIIDDKIYLRYEEDKNGDRLW